MRSDLVERFTRADGTAFSGRVIGLKAASGDAAYPGESAAGTLAHTGGALAFQSIVRRERDGSLWRVTGEDRVPPSGSGLSLSLVSVVRAG